jgi:hypothetical protein
MTSQFKVFVRWSRDNLNPIRWVGIRLAEEFDIYRFISIFEVVDGVFGVKISAVSSVHFSRDIQADSDFLRFFFKLSSIECLLGHVVLPSGLFQQSRRDADPLRIKWFPANGLACATVPIRRVAIIPFLAMQVSVNPRTIPAFVLLGRFVRSPPIALGIPPQSGEGVRESG